MLGEIYPGCIPLGGPNSGLFLEIGRTAFSTTDTEASIRTQLDEISIGHAWAYDTYSPNTDATALATQLFVEAAVSSGAVKVTRSSQGAISALAFQYMLIGRKYATS